MRQIYLIYLICLTLGGAALVLSAPCLAADSALAAQRRPTPSITVLPSTGPRILSRHGHITFHLKIVGLIWDVRHIGKRPIVGHGHIQFYLDRIPSDAYTQADLRHGWLAFSATPIFTLELAASPIRIRRGQHRILVAVAQNDFRLYRGAPAAVSVTVR